MRQSVQRSVRLVLLVGLVGGTSVAVRGDAPSEVLVEVPAAAVMKEIRHVEEFLGAEFSDYPTIVVGSRAAIAAGLAREPRTDEPDGVVRVLGLDRARAALGLPSVDVHVRLVVDAWGFYDRDVHRIVLRGDSKGYSRSVHGETLVHELTHALSRSLDQATIGPSTADADVAAWMFEEGRAEWVASTWAWKESPPVSPTAQPAGAETPVVSLNEAGYLLGEWRVDFAVRNSEYFAAVLVDAPPPVSAATFIDLALPLDWQPAKPDRPNVPPDSTLLGVDRLGMFGWLEVLESAGVRDVGSVLAWRGDATVAYVDAAGPTCVASTLELSGQTAARRFARALRTALPSADITARAATVSLRSCDAAMESTPGVTVRGYGALLSIVETANGLSARHPAGSSGAIDAAAAMCAADRLHSDNDWTTIYSGLLDDLSQQTEQAVAHCRSTAPANEPTS